MDIHKTESWGNVTGDFETMTSDQGPIEALRQKRGGTWQIMYPGGGLEFDGDRNQVRAEMRRFKREMAD